MWAFVYSHDCVAILVPSSKTAKFELKIKLENQGT